MKDKVLLWLVMALLFAGTALCIIGAEKGIVWIIGVAPVGAGVLGAIIDIIINGKRSESYLNASFNIYMLIIVTAVLLNQNTTFIIGGIMCCLGCVLLNIRSYCENREIVEREYKEEIERLKRQNKWYEEQMPNKIDIDKVDEYVQMRDKILKNIENL